MRKLFIAMLAIASFSAMAQEGQRHGPRHAENPLTPEQVATLQTKRMTLALDLTQVQQEQVQKFHLENARLRKEKMDSWKEERNERPGKDLSAEERFSRESERLDHMIASKAAMRNILNEEQFEKWEKVRKHRKHHRPHGDRHGQRRP